MPEEEKQAEDSMQRIVRACKVLSTIIKIIFAVLCVYWVFTTCFMVYTVFTDPTGSSGGLDFLRIVLHLAYIAVIVALFVVINGMFTDVAKGQTPFAMVQVKRLSIISVLLVAYCVLDIAITSNNALLQYSGLNTGFVSTNENVIIPVNFSPLIAAAIVFAFSFVFKYGVLLQEFSDETL